MSEKGTAEIQVFIGKKIRELRASKGYSQKFVAEQTDLNRAYISSLENGKKNVTLEVLIKIALCLEVSLPELFEQPKSMSDKEKQNELINFLLIPIGSISTLSTLAAVGRFASSGVVGGIGFAANATETGVKLLKRYFKA